MTKPKETPPRALGLRVPESLYQVLEIACFLEDKRSMQELLGPLIEAKAEDYAKIPELKAIQRSRGEYQARKEGKLRRISSGKSEGKP